MDKIFFYLLKKIGIEDGTFIAEAAFDLMLLSAIIFTGIVYYHLIKKLGLYFNTTKKELSTIHARFHVHSDRIDAIEKRSQEEYSRMTKILDTVSAEFKNGMADLKSAMGTLSELTIYNKEVKDKKTIENRIKIKEAGINSWLRCKRRLKEWTRNTFTSEFIASQTGIDLYSMFLQKALEIYSEDDRKTKTNIINEVENQPLNVIDNKVLPSLQQSMLGVINQIKEDGKYTRDHEDEIDLKIEQHKNMWERYFDLEYVL